MKIDGILVEADPRYDYKFGETKYFSDQEWIRRTAEDGTSASGRGPDDFNWFWGNISAQWTSPIDFVSYGDAAIFS